MSLSRSFFRNRSALALVATCSWGGSFACSSSADGALSPASEPPAPSLASEITPVSEVPVSQPPAPSPAENAPPVLIAAPSEPETPESSNPSSVDPGVGEACASVSAASRLAQATLFVALDKSNSMGAGAFDRRWAPLTTALKAFFADEGSQGLRASLQLFPPSDVMGRRNPGCTVESYDAPDVAITPLPDPGTFATLIDATEVSGGTPTAAVLTALATRAEALVDNDPDESAALLLVTDGTPSQCDVGPQNSIEGIVQVVERVADRIPTYAVGLGESLDPLNRIAEAGGTESAVLVKVGDPEATRLAVLERLNAIRREVVSCNVPIPEPPEGRQLEPTKVAAQVQTPGAPPETLPFEADCATGAGWRYDDAASPTTIQLCEQACDAVKQRGGASLEVVFGCAENPRIIQAIR